MNFCKRRPFWTDLSSLSGQVEIVFFFEIHITRDFYREVKSSLRSQQLKVKRESQWFERKSFSPLPLLWCRKTGWRWTVSRSDAVRHGVTAGAEAVGDRYGRVARRSGATAALRTRAVRRRGEGVFGGVVEHPVGGLSTAENEGEPRIYSRGAVTFTSVVLGRWLLFATATWGTGFTWVMTAHEMLRPNTTQVTKLEKRTNFFSPRWIQTGGIR